MTSHFVQPLERRTLFNAGTLWNGRYSLNVQSGMHKLLQYDLVTNNVYGSSASAHRTNTLRNRSGC